MFVSFSNERLSTDCITYNLEIEENSTILSRTFFALNQT